MGEGLNRTNSDKWWKIAHVYRGRVCWHPLAQNLGLLRSGPAGSTPGAAPTRGGTITIGPVKLTLHAIHAERPSGSTSGPGGRKTGNGSISSAAPGMQWKDVPGKDDHLNGAEKPNMQFGGTIHAENPTDPVDNAAGPVGAPANVMAEQDGPTADEITAALMAAWPPGHPYRTDGSAGA